MRSGAPFGAVGSAAERRGSAAANNTRGVAMKIVMVGQGAFGRKHLDGLKNIPGVEVASLVGGGKESTEAVAKQYGIPHWTTSLSEALAQPGVEAAILTSPTQVHASQ